MPVEGMSRISCCQPRQLIAVSRVNNFLEIAKRDTHPDGDESNRPPSPTESMGGAVRPIAVLADLCAASGHTPLGSGNAFWQGGASPARFPLHGTSASTASRRNLVT